MSQAAVIVRTGRKFDQVLDGARTVFLKDGFEGASVDDIARAAGVSKATLYSYFPDKRLLFMEVARVECMRLAELAVNEIDATLPPREVLTRTAQKLIPFMLSEFSIKMFRICVAESDRFPELGADFYASGPEMGRKRLVEYMGKARDRGELKIEDLSLAAEQFSELCKSHLFARAVFGIQTSFTQAEIDRVVQSAVDVFMARYSA
ncbi:TetR/AcrR family transcriptional regulator [Chachezhania sediminis]|uniref:TetR/AcrR family transcriptional regulator n=1 Tax=Chachezhania sediminis TaxID=2599291 RepID=UPI00131DF0B9|nr:TetR/AcrR family transcriptional regulator [Chachezhania sediminis]